jgi:hypothetical protein
MSKVVLDLQELAVDRAEAFVEVVHIGRTIAR